MKHWLVGVALAAGIALVGGNAARAEEGKAALDPALKKLSGLVGGTWVGEPGSGTEFRYEWDFKGSVIRGSGWIGKGTKNEQRAEAFMGWDAEKKQMYYLDFHGGSTVYRGTGRLEGEELHFEFETLIGSPAKWRSVERFTDSDTYEFTILGLKDGKWEKVHTGRLTRRR